MSLNTIQSGYLVNNFRNSLAKSQHEKLLITHYGQPVAYLVSLQDMCDQEHKLMAKLGADSKANPGIINIIADCEDCGEKFNQYDDVKESAAYHAMKFKHLVHLEIITWFKYDGRKAAKVGAPAPLKVKS